MAVANPVALGEYIPRIIKKDSRYIYNFCTKYLARTSNEARYNYGQFETPGDFRATLCEPWRFPIIDSYYDKNDPENSALFNQVTFVYYVGRENLPNDVAVIGTFANLYQPIPLEQVENSPYFALTLVIPKGQVHHYKYRVDGQWQLDPINTQRMVLPNGEIWSRFFTHCCHIPLTFEPWELKIMNRLVMHILPFNTKEGKRFLESYSNTRNAYRLDESIGVVNFIDKLIAKEENHHLADYRTCLDIFSRVLRQRIPALDVERMPESVFVELYDQMASGNVPGWDYSRYGNPRYFLSLLRRHVFTGAFAHPKYHGNASSIGWAYLEETYANAGDSTSIYQWRLAMEKSCGGHSEEYLG
jgi:Glycogen recognition site of AMP-activated protein kinase/Gluconate 2-dehydrogenase subunit 3